ncbi:MAG TPA: glycosyltransferase family 1 protein [Thermomicrobiales bacterium]|nr:glycosyltransferase family 1 protein [Thermomicrobiales bacterium]
MSRLRVLLDATWAAGRGGTARYVRSLADALSADPTIDIIVVRSPRLTRGPRAVRLPLNGSVHLLWTQLCLPLLARHHGADVVQSTMTAPLRCPRPVVLTLHDALDFVPELRPSRIWSWYMQTVGVLAARRAAVVLTGTRASAAEIVRCYRLAPEKARVTPYGSAMVRLTVDCHDTTGANPCPGCTYALLVGTADKRKDFETALRAIALVRATGSDLAAVVVGSAPAAYADAAWVRVVVDIDDGQLASLYRRAALVLVSSRHEGYGLPVLEALAFGTPVVASDIAALREVGGEAVRYAAPGDAEAFARQIVPLLEDPAGERERVRRSTSAGSVARWGATARATTDVYREVLGART